MNDDNAAQQLTDAIEKNDIVTASSLISSSGVNLNDKPWPLHAAAEHGRLEIMTLLLDAGADIDVCDRIGLKWTACHYAIYYNELDALKLLVERGARLNGLNVSLLKFAIECDEHSNYRIVIYLFEAGASLDNLTRCQLMSLVRSVGLYKQLLTRGVNFDAMRDESGYTLCHHVASYVTDENDIRFLLGDVCGSQSANAVNNRGQTPFHCAAHARNIAAMRLLVELGANIDAKDDYGLAAVHFAASQFEASLELLLALGADVRLVTNRGRTPFDFALGSRNKSALALLIVAGGDLDQPNVNGVSLRMTVHRDVELPTADEIDAARQRIAKARLDLVRYRAAEICIGLQQLDLNALQLCEILMHSFGAIGSVISFHQWWAIATKVKHFRSNSM